MMKFIFSKKILLTCALFAAAAFCTALQAQQKNAKAQTLIIEAEKFQFPADWTVAKYLHKLVLQSAGALNNPCTVIDIPQDGKYYIWVYAYDNLTEQPRTRSFKLAVNGEELPELGGTHGLVTGLEWQKLGEAELKKGDALLEVRPSRPKLTGIRVDAIMLTQNPNMNPTGRFATNSERYAYWIESKPAECEFETEFSHLSALKDIENPESVSVSNKFIKIAYTQKAAPDGKKYFERSAECYKTGRTLPLPALDKELLFISYSPDAQEKGDDYYGAWTKTLSYPKIIVDGKRFETKLSAFCPYLIGVNTILRPVSAVKEGEDAILLGYENGVRAKLTLAKDSPAAKFEVSAKADKEGYYSIGFAGFYPTQKSNLNTAVLPPMFQQKRMMSAPKLVGNSMTSHPLSMIESKEGGTRFTNALVADPAKLPFGEWSKNGNSIYGFSLASALNEIQPVIFRPILGGRDSFKKAGQEIDASWYILTVCDAWSAALEISSTKIFSAGKLREPYNASLSQALENIAVYLADKNANGWSDHLKGRWNIESLYTATQASPLAEIEVAILTDDEDYYKNIALPTLEFTLSRPGFHFSDRFGQGRTTEGTTTLHVPSTALWGDYYAGANRLLGGGNTWAKEFYDIRPGRFGYSSAPAWTAALGVYLAAPTPELLAQIKADADKWIKEAYLSKDYNEPEYMPFVNVKLYPYWWYLADLYEITKEKKYLDYALEGAYWTASSLWVYPTPPEGDWMVHKDGVVEGTGKNWWKGEEVFRLGYGQSREAVDKYIEGKNLNQVTIKSLYPAPAHLAPAMQVSRVGLGIEQLITYKIDHQNYKNIIMPSWSAEMLKVYQYTNKDLIMKFARHSIIGRYANFLGYYVKDYTDVFANPEYPYKGPDITSLYFHHAPCHFAQTYDFLMAEAESRTQNLIKFPFVRQQGYVWFTDRIFGPAGKVFDEDARPFISIGGVKADTPKVSVLTARAKDGLWVILLNDAGKPIQTSVTFDASKKFIKDADLKGKYKVFSAEGAAEYEGENAAQNVKVKIPALGLKAIRLAAAPFEVNPQVKPIEAPSHIKLEKLGEGWEELHLFRIRGPFGKDSVYAVLICKSDKKAKLTLHLENDGKDYVCSRYPYELSIYPIAQNEDAKFSITIEEDGKPAIKTQTITLGK